MGVFWIGKLTNSINNVHNNKINKMNNKLSQNGYNKLHGREGLELHPYLDTQNVPTIAMGNTYYLDGRKVTMKDKPLTLAEAIELGKLTADDFAKYVDAKIKTKVNQDQFDACVSIAYNIGKTGFANSTFLRLINIDPNDIKIADAIAMWRKNKEIIGRRASELKQYFSYNSAPTSVKRYIDNVIKDKLT